MAEIQYTPFALDDLVRMWTYIAEELHSPLAADNITAKITSSVRSLGQFPMSGEAVEVRSGSKTDLRYTVSRKRIIVYRYEKMIDTVLILRIFNGGENWLQTLFMQENEHIE